MNKVILMGRLTRDPEVRYSNQGDGQLAIARFTLAVDRRMARREGSDQQTADFISCTAFGRQGEFAERYLHQGTKVVLEGRIQTGSYTNREGQKVYTTDVIAESIEFAESKAASAGNAGGANSGAGGSYRQNSGYSSSRPDPARASGDGFVNIPDGVEDEELPFN
ncbi:MAG: single-stranded DNA-binding protein [Lachnospiraceae bacterium]|nr:single-stranded DNA-binding protein [Lachnospiraceae bacterium]